MNALKVARIIWKIIFAFFGGNLVNEFIVHGPPGGGFVGLLDDLVVIALGTTYELGLWGGLALTVFAGEIRKIIEDADEYWSMSDNERETLRTQLRQQHPIQVYVYGRLNVDDAIKLWFSGRYLARTELGQSVFQAVSDIFELLPDLAEVALVG